MLSKVHYALIIRQRYPYLRKTGPTLGKVCFEDNAAILLDQNKKVKKVAIKGVVAKEISYIKKYSGLNGVFR